MKKNVPFLICLIIVMLASGCIIDLKDSISGDGHVVTQTRKVPEFSGIKVGTGIDVYISQGDTQSVEVEADGNLQEWIRTEVNGSVLHIYTHKTIRFADTKTVKLTCKSIDKIDVSSAGNVTGISKFKADNLDIDLSSMGDLKLEVDAEEISISLSSSGNADLKGHTKILRADLSSAGDLNAFDLESKIADISVSSAGNAQVFVTDEASFRSSSAGNISYKGEPRIKEIHTSSAGNVNKR